MSKLKSCFEALGFSGGDLDKIVDSFSLKIYKKGDFFIEEGKTSKHLGFVESGMFQYYFLIDGEERTTYITIENSFMASLQSIITETPSLESVKALTDGSVFLISKADLKSLANEIPLFKDFYIRLLEESICGIVATRHDLIVLSGEQRYEKMLREEPHLLQQIPLQYLASMLGVTPRHLSRIRGQIR